MDFVETGCACCEDMCGCACHWQDDEETVTCKNCERRVNLYEEEIYPLLWPVEDGPTKTVYYCKECVNALKMV